jgi:hypothetical protein
MNPNTVTSGHLAPADKPRFVAPAAVQEIVEPGRESARSGGRFHRVTERHLFERENHAVSRPLFDARRARRDLGILALFEKAAKLVTIQRLFPALVRFPFVIAFPGEVSLVSKTFREEAQKFSATLRRAGGLSLGHRNLIRGAAVAQM